MCGSLRTRPWKYQKGGSSHLPITAVAMAECCHDQSDLCTKEQQILAWFPGLSRFDCLLCDQKLDGRKAWEQGDCSVNSPSSLCKECDLLDRLTLLSDIFEGLLLFKGQSHLSRGWELV